MTEGLAIALLIVGAAWCVAGLLLVRLARRNLDEANAIMDETMSLAREQVNEALERARALHKRRDEDV